MVGKTREKPIMNDYIYCNNCKNLLSSKTFKEHHHIYLHQGRWLKVKDCRSGSSSPLDMSPPLSSLSPQPLSLAT